MPLELKVAARFKSRKYCGVVYEVLMDENGFMSCSCPSWFYRRHCRHVNRIKSMIQSGNYNLYDDDTIVYINISSSSSYKQKTVDK